MEFLIGIVIDPMKFNLEKHHRHSMRLKNYDYSNSGFYFVTICVKDRECLFGKIFNRLMELSEMGRTVEKLWVEIPGHYSNVKLGQFIVMPNHIHGIIVIREQSNDGKHEDGIKTAHTKSLMGKGLRMGRMGRGLINQAPTIDNPPSTIENPPPTIENPYDGNWILMKNRKLLLGKIIREFKARATYNIRGTDDFYFQWQRNYYDHIIEYELELCRIQEYISSNPRNWEEDEENPVQFSHSHI